MQRMTKKRKRKEVFPMKQEKTKVYIYTRVSTAMQVDGYSLEAQKERMQA